MDSYPETRAVEKPKKETVLERRLRLCRECERAQALVTQRADELRTLFGEHCPLAAELKLVASLLFHVGMAL